MLVSFCHCYLVDPASSHTLVLKIKPCMYKCFVFITLDCGRLIITVIVLLRLLYRWIPVVIPEFMGDFLLGNPPINKWIIWVNHLYFECDNHQKSMLSHPTCFFGWIFNLPYDNPPKKQILAKIQVIYLKSCTEYYRDSKSEKKKLF